MYKRNTMIGMVMATSMTITAPAVVHAASTATEGVADMSDSSSLSMTDGTMSAEDVAARLQQSFSLDPEIGSVIDANVRDGKIVVTGQIEDADAYERVQQIIRDMDIDDDMIQNEVAKL